MIVELGSRVRDRINGFEGVVTGRAEYLFGCRQVLVAPEVLPADGKHPESTWLDEDRVQIVISRAIAADSAPDSMPAAGGPLTDPEPPKR